ncbi:uncharacterized protein LOC108194647 [Daucus carota subsp. sativus]|uniref:uncharacterized protein LOC108194647 n=1 Tax=Daucus carota subsp. sativus TaxID=79200 RepID=UPI0007EF6524|nr:PREDICTED: uncharacterized protein LOC108194647 [Daucus carota subsp. sativus]
MAFISTTPLNKLNSSKIKWVIRVRAQAIWKGITRETNEFRGINMLFIDDSNTRIHAFINARISGPFEPSLEEGQMYTISNFSVQSYTGYEGHRCVRTDHHIYFSDYTIMHKITTSIPRIPDFSFDIFDLLYLDQTTDEKRFLFDVVGILMNREPIRKYVSDTQEEKILLKFSICDGRCDKALDKDCDEPVVIIIGCAKIGHYQGELTINNYPATRLFVNVNHHIVRIMRIRAADPSFGKNLVLLEDRPEEVVMSIASIKELKEEFNQKRVYCSVKIEKVEDMQWFYHCCPKCSEELVAVDGRFKCTKYNCYIPFPDRRFRISTICSDVSGVIFIVLGDSEVRQIVQKTVFEVDLDHSKVKGSNDSKLPNVFKDLVGKSYTITLKISMENVLKKSEIYESVEIVSSSGSFAEQIECQENSTEIDESCGLSGTEVGSVPPSEVVVCSPKSSGKDKLRKDVVSETAPVLKDDDDFVLLQLIPGVKTKKSKK